MTDSPVSFGVVGAIWVAIGLFLCVAMGRRGYHAAVWLVLGMLLGPFAVILALVAAHGPGPERPDRAGGPGPERPDLTAGPRPMGSVDVLVGYDGSDEARSAPEAARELLGDRVGRLTIATVVPYDCAKDIERLARRELGEVATAIEGIRATTLVLHGRPAVVLGEHAAADGYDLVVIAPRGAGESRSILGSTAKELARRSRVPVLLIRDGADGHVADGRPALLSGGAG